MQHKEERRFSSRKIESILRTPTGEAETPVNANEERAAKAQARKAVVTPFEMMHEDVLLVRLSTSRFDSTELGVFLDGKKVRCVLIDAAVTPQVDLVFAKGVGDVLAALKDNGAKRCAFVSTSASQRMLVTTSNLLSGMKVRGYEEKGEALAWLLTS